MDNIIIQDASLEDAERISDIYAYYVKNTAITFEYDVPTLNEIQNRIKNTMEHFPYLVIKQAGIIQGYTYASPSNTWAAYSRACETSIYISHTAQKCGLGRKIYETLEHRLKEMGMFNLYACVAYPGTEDSFLNKNSAGFHEYMGFSKIGEFHKCGYKSGRWYNMVYMEKLIGQHCASGFQAI